MLKIVQAKPAFFTEIKRPSSPMIRENNEVEIGIVVFPRKYNAPPRNRQRIIVMASYKFRVFMTRETFEVANCNVHYDIFADRDMQLMELYRLSVTVANSLKEHIFSQNIPFLRNEDFPLDPPDVIRAKMLRVLKTINDSKSMFMYELN